MSRDQDKHNKIVRNRIIAVITAVILLAVLIFCIFLGLFNAFAALKKSGVMTGTETAPSVSSTEEEETDLEISFSRPQTNDNKKTAEEHPAEDHLEEQYEEVVSGEQRSASALEIEEIIDSMSLEDRVSQLFFVRPEQLTLVDTVTKGGDATRAALEKYHVGGIIYFSKNFINPDQTAALLENTDDFARENGGIPLFLGVDEEGGSVARLASNPEFAIDNTPSMADIGASGDPEKAYEAGKHIGGYLGKAGLNLDFAPVADVAQGTSSAVGSRSFGSDAGNVSKMAGEYARGLNESGIIACYKHFPGFGRAAANTDHTEVSIDASAEDLRQSDLIPFNDAIGSGCEMMVMAGNMAFPEITGDDTPSCMSVMMITDYLRGELKYNGVVITDALDAAAVRNRYDSGEAAVKALKAGVDMLLSPSDFEGAYNAVMEAVQSGEISEERINASVSRILTLKSRIMGL